jgi:hypothetical protein
MPVGERDLRGGIAELARAEIEPEAVMGPSFRDGPKDQTSDAQLRIGESRDSGFDASLRIAPE